MDLEARHLDNPEASHLGIDPGWWAFDEMGPILGPYASKETLLLFAAIEPRSVCAQFSDEQ